jgi:hypothetical protein
MKDYHSGPGKYWEPFAFPVGCSGTEEEEGLRIGSKRSALW